MTLKVLVMSALDSLDPWPAGWMGEIAWSMVVYCMENSGLGIRVLMFGTVELWEVERSLFP